MARIDHIEQLQLFDKKVRGTIRGGSSRERDLFTPEVVGLYPQSLLLMCLLRAHVPQSIRELVCPGLVINILNQVNRQQATGAYCVIIAVKLGSQAFKSALVVCDDLFHMFFVVLYWVFPETDPFKLGQQSWLGLENIL